MMRPVVIGYFDHNPCCGQNIPVEVVYPIEIGMDHFFPVPPRCGSTFAELRQTRMPDREWRDIR